jgi:hypothetical protein
MWWTDMAKLTSIAVQLFIANTPKIQSLLPIKHTAFPLQKPDGYMVLREIITVYFKTHSKSIYKFSQQMQRF